MTIAELIELEGGLLNVCKIFGWQGGTIHQVEIEIKRRFAKSGIIFKDNHAVRLEITNR